jgi:aldehyde dehydrogenase (NAD+)
MDIASVIQGQRNFFNSQTTKSYDFRKNALLTLQRLVQKNEAQFLEALRQDLGKSQFEAYATEFGVSLHEINLCLKNLKSWMKPRKVSTPIVAMPGRSYILPEPLGVSLIISPWNYPLYLALAPIASALAAGNAVILKPSEFSSHTSQVLADTLNAQFDPGLVRVVLGDAAVAQALLKERFDKIFFTGSTAVGRSVAVAAAQHLTPCTLELGGKSPAIVDRGMCTENVVKRLVWSKFLNSGQTCVAPDYLYVPEEDHNIFVGMFTREIEKIYAGGFKPEENYSRIISQRHFDRLEKMIDAKKVVYRAVSERENRLMGPVVMTRVTWQDAIMQEEIFGPILPILTYRDLSEALTEIQKRDKPLALYVFTENTLFKERVLSELSFGGGCINDCVMHLGNSNLPFGGVGASGMGRYHGQWGFDEFSHFKSILDKPLFFEPFIKYPPFTKQKFSIMRKLLG